MDLSQWQQKHGRNHAKALAERVGTSYQYLYQMTTGRRTPSVEMVKSLVAADEFGDLTREGLRPDVWGDPLNPENQEAAANG